MYCYREVLGREIVGVLEGRRQFVKGLREHENRLRVARPFWRGDVAPRREISASKPRKVTDLGSCRTQSWASEHYIGET